MLRKPLIIWLAIVGIASAGCTLVQWDAAPRSHSSLADLTEVELLPGEALRVVVTTSILGDVVANVAGDAVDLRVLLPAGADPHSYQTTPQDLTIIADAHVVFISGLGLETFLEDALINAGGQSVVISLSEGVPARAIAENEIEPDHAEGYEDIDPHVWLDPYNVEIWIENARSALTTLDPDNAARFSSSANRYLISLYDLQAWIQEQVDSIPAAGRKLVTDHGALGYFSDRYGFEFVGSVIPASHTAAQVSAQELAALQKAIRESGAQAIFVAAGSIPFVPQQLASDLDLQLVPLHIGALSDPGGPAASYLDLMHYNVNAIVDALRH